MTKLSDIQLVILGAASQRPNRIVLPLPDRRAHLGPAHRDIRGRRRQGRHLGCDAAFEVLSLEAPSGPTAASTAAASPSESPAPNDALQPPASHPRAPRGKTREGTKQAQLIAMLRRAEGATIAQIVEAIGWQPPTVRGAFAGALKNRLGLDVASEKVEGRGRVYHIAG